MVDRKIHFAWNLGGGPGEVTHPVRIQTAEEHDTDKFWYRIEAERYVYETCNLEIYSL